MSKNGVAFSLAFAFAFILVLAFTPFTLWAGGWNNTLLGCRAIAMGGAFTGLADDPTAIYYNPAGIVFQRNRFNLSIDGFYVLPTYEYTTQFGYKIQSKYDSALPQLFLTYRTSEKITLGVGFYVPYAGSGVDWSGREIGSPLKSTLGVYSLTPTMAYHISEKLSFGVNLNFYTAVFDLKTGWGPYSYEMKQEEKGSALSVGLGLMYRPSEKLGFGFTLRGPAEIKMTGVTSLPLGEVPDTLKLDSETVIKLPWDVEVGLAFRASENFLFTASAQYTLWSTLDRVKKTIKDIPFMGDLRLDEEMNFENILILRFGAEYLIPQGMFLRGGIGFDQSASPSSSLSIANIDVDKVSLLGGIGFRSGRVQIDFAAAYAFGKEREKEIPAGAMIEIEKYNLNVFILGLGVTLSY
jgi:long-chain fatty acid transport protein